MLKLVEQWVEGATSTATSTGVPARILGSVLKTMSPLPCASVVPVTVCFTVPYVEATVTRAEGRFDLTRTVWRSPAGSDGFLTVAEHA